MLDSKMKMKADLLKSLIDNIDLMPKAKAMADEGEKESGEMEEMEKPVKSASIIAIGSGGHGEEEESEEGDDDMKALLESLIGKMKK